MIMKQAFLICFLTLWDHFIGWMNYHSNKGQPIFHQDEVVYTSRSTGGLTVWKPDREREKWITAVNTKSKVISKGEFPHLCHIEEEDLPQIESWSSIFLMLLSVYLLSIYLWVSKFRPRVRMIFLNKGHGPKISSVEKSYYRMVDNSRLKNRFLENIQW